MALGNLSVQSVTLFGKCHRLIFWKVEEGLEVSLFWRMLSVWDEKIGSLSMHSCFVELFEQNLRKSSIRIECYVL